MIISNTTFHPVGQGLFSSGFIKNSDTFEEFHWVFDCGSESKGHPKPEVRAYMLSNGLLPIDMFCISHYDEDHVKGARRLLRACGAKIIILPYLSLHQRITLAVSRNASGPFLRFLVDPASFVLSLAGPGSRLIFIQGGGGEIGGEDKNLDEPDLGPPDLVRDDFSESDFHSAVPEDYGAIQEPDLANRIEIITDRVRLLTFAGTSNDVWEFCFYNWDQPKKVPQNLTRDVTAILNRTRLPKNRFKTVTIRELRDYYAIHYGTNSPIGKAVLTGEPANRISLVMYSGPTSPSSASTIPAFVSNPALLCTGDIYLHNANRTTAIKRHFGTPRWQRIGVLQVPHHGAKANWYHGSATSWNHSVSVFSYGIPNSYKHPHPMVLNDLSMRIPMHVTQFSGWGFNVLL